MCIFPHLLWLWLNHYYRRDESIANWSILNDSGLAKTRIRMQCCMVACVRVYVLFDQHDSKLHTHQINDMTCNRYVPEVFCYCHRSQQWQNRRNKSNITWQIATFALCTGQSTGTMQSGQTINKVNTNWDTTIIRIEAKSDYSSLHPEKWRSGCWRGDDGPWLVYWWTCWLAACRTQSSTRIAWGQCSSEPALHLVKWKRSISY